MTSQDTTATFVFVGTYTRSDPRAARGAEGIYVYRLDPSTGALTHAHTMAGVVNPSFVALDPRHRCLYAVNEVQDIDGRTSGAASAFHIDPATGALSFLNRQSSGGTGPCHLSVDQTGRYVLVANYSGGSVAMLPIEDGGRLGPASDFVQHVGSSVNPRRQEGPHAHSINLDPTNRFALVADLGLDRVLVYRLDLERGKLVPNDVPWAPVHPGAGPRHLDFHPNGRFVYVINELDSTMTTFAWDGERGTLREIQNLSTLPPGFAGTSYCADVHVAPSGRFVYGSNRGDDSIAIFAVDAETGQLTPVGHESTRGKTPRNFALDPAGTLLLAANQDTDTIVTFRIDPETGKPTPTGQVASVPMPVCLKFAHPSP
ncbi:MAG: lactonase family protein [Chloroflexi bacterium]|nr:lactonase family protein [Chloroflexota bacterium]